MLDVDHGHVGEAKQLGGFHPAMPGDDTPVLGCKHGHEEAECRDDPGKFPDLRLAVSARIARCRRQRRDRQVDHEVVVHKSRLSEWRTTKSRPVIGEGTATGSRVEQQLRRRAWPSCGGVLPRRRRRSAHQAEPSKPTSEHGPEFARPPPGITGSVLEVSTTLRCSRSILYGRARDRSTNCSNKIACDETACCSELSFSLA